MQCVEHRTLLKGFNMWQQKVEVQFDGEKAKNTCEALCSFLLRNPGAQLQIRGRYGMAFLSAHKLCLQQLVETFTWYLEDSFPGLPRPSGIQISHLHKIKGKMKSPSVLFGHFIQRWRTEGIDDQSYLLISTFATFLEVKNLESAP